MAKYKETPRYNVISMRVNEDERKALRAIASHQKISISKMMRQAMERFTARRYGADVGHTVQG